MFVGLLPFSSSCLTHSTSHVLVAAVNARLDAGKPKKKSSGILNAKIFSGFQQMKLSQNMKIGKI